jgi:hypothetical protein
VQLAKPSQVQLAKPSQAQLAKPSQVQLAKPSQAQLAKPSQVQLAKPSQVQLVQRCTRSRQHAPRQAGTRHMHDASAQLPGTHQAVDCGQHLDGAPVRHALKGKLPEGHVELEADVAELALPQLLLGGGEEGRKRQQVREGEGRWLRDGWQQVQKLGQQGGPWPYAGCSGA